MSSPISFGGKCLTVLIGAALSWMTIANPNVDQAVGHMLGMRRDDLNGVADSSTYSSSTSNSLTQTAQTKALPDFGSLVGSTTTADSTNAPNNHFASSPIAMPRFVPTQPKRTATQPEPSAAALASPEARIQEITNQLKSLGASYVLLERLPQASDNLYRARCDLAGSGSAVKCCFEAVRSTPNEAMEDVLHEVVSRRTDSTSSQVNAGLASPPT